LHINKLARPLDGLPLAIVQATGDSGKIGGSMTKGKLFETVTVFTIALLGLTVLVPAASAQSGQTFRFVIPFDFYAGAVLMPAGEYTVSQAPGTRATQIYDRNGHVTSILPIVGNSTPIRNNRMVFNRYGSMNFLSEIQWALSETGYKVRESNLERETRLGTSPVRVAVQPQQ
jgi:hypothetical protein